ncbi:MAG TPA: hypothetical protein VFK13_14210 [Gemmatimonadaceae bacterium]|nr:hypothetical protein [Gemmatimonadaceae bacterium]
MLFRGKPSPTGFWQRFRSAADGFSFHQEGDYYAAHVVANAERVVDLFVVLLEEMPPAVDVALSDQRSGHRWEAPALPLPDVRDALAPIKGALAAFGGVEVTVFTSEDQLTLNGVVELFIYARTDRWRYILQGKGLEEHRLMRTRSWKLHRPSPPPAPELTRAIERLAADLRLSRA